MEIYYQQLRYAIEDITHRKNVIGQIFILPKGSSYFYGTGFKSYKYIAPVYEINDKEFYRSFTKYLYEQLKEKSLIMHYEDYKKFFDPYQIDGDLFNGKINHEHFEECLKFLYYSFGKEGISFEDLLKEVDKISNFLYFKLVG